MIRIVTLAAAAALLALPASAGPSIRIATAGKSAEQVKLEVVKAANSLCARASVGATFPFEAQRACVKNTVEKTVLQPGFPKSTQLAKR